MNLAGRIVYSLVLFACAAFAAFDTFAFAFGIGDGGGQASLLAKTFLIGTLAGGVGLVIAALASWTRSPGISIFAIVCILVVLPAAVMFGWQSVRAFSNNTQHGYHYGWGAWASAILPPFLTLLAVALSWIRLRSLRSFAVRDTAAR